MNDILHVSVPECAVAAAPSRDPVVAAMTAAVAEPFLILDRRRRVRGWNPAATGLLGLEATQPDTGLARLLAGATRMDAATREAVAATASAAIEGGALSPSRPLGLRVHQIGPHRWMLVFPAEQDAKMADLVLTDPLTGLANRRAFQQALAGLMPATATRPGGPSVLLIDLDQFKQVNDRLGHPIGDALLMAVGRRLRSALRDTDRVFRLGGDEFAVIVDTPDRAEAVATRLVDLLSRTYLVQGHVCTIGASIGIATAPSDGDTGDELVRCADLALYQAKAEGRQCVRRFHPELDAKARTRHAIEADLRLALVRDQLELHYQAQIDLAGGHLAGFEALLRWRHPERGLVPPDSFIRIAEEIGLIVPFGEWVIRTACRVCASWPAPLVVAVNVSVLQLTAAANLVETVKSALAASGLPAARLEIEITESALLGDQATPRAILLALRDMGVRISMDDFGTGYSSLSQLRSFPFDKIKIDRSFIGDMASSSEATAMVRAVTTLGASLGMTTTAEGVETAEQARQLGIEGCTYMQGYLISRPLPQDQIQALIARHATHEPLPPFRAESET